MGLRVFMPVQEKKREEEDQHNEEQTPGPGSRNKEKRLKVVKRSRIDSSYKTPPFNGPSTQKEDFRRFQACFKGRRSRKTACFKPFYEKRAESTIPRGAKPLLLAP